MHPYEIQRLLRERHRLDMLKRGSLYHAIGRLERSKLIEAGATARNGRRPERTTYRITAEGRREVMRWLRGLIAVPQPETSEFMAGTSFLVHLTPEDATAQLERRAALLKEDIDVVSKQLPAAIARAGRINLLEVEYALAMRRAELKWVRDVLREIRSGRLIWDLHAILKALKAKQRGAKE